MSSSNTGEASELLSLLESNDLHLVEDVKTMIHENLSTAREPCYLNGLFDYYIASGSQRAMEILTTVREPFDKHLFEKLNECLRSFNKMAALTLLGCVVRKQPSWLHKIIHSPLFVSLLNCIKNDTDVPVVMSSVLIITTLLPIVPSSVGQYLQDIFEGFSRLSSWKLKPPAIVPEVHILHLQVAVYSLFHRLYGMYPCNFLSYLRSNYGKDNSAEFNQIILPMLEHVRMHPCLVTGSKDMETDTSRWIKMESHDIVMECAKVSLDMYESTREAGSLQTPKSVCKVSSNTASEEGSSEHRSHSIISPKSLESSLTTTPKKNLKPSLSREMESVWSPSVLCGLSTPPCQISPSSSVADLSGSLYSSVPATPTSVNVTTPTQANIFTYGTPWDESRRTPLSKANILTRLTKSLSKSDTPSPPPQSEEIKKSDQSSETSSKYESLITVLERQTDTSKKESFDENIVEEMQMERDELKVKERERKVSVKDLPKLIEGLSKSMEQGQEDDDVNEEISAIVNTPHDTDSENNDVDRSSSTPFKSTTEFLTGPSSFPEKQFYHDPTHDDPQINFCSDSSSQIDDFFRIRSSSDPVSAKSKLFQRRLNKLEQNHSGRSSIERPIPFEKLGLIENAFQDRYFENPAMVDVCVGTDDRSFTPIREQCDISTQNDISQVTGNEMQNSHIMSYLNFLPAALAPPVMMSEYMESSQQYYTSPSGSSMNGSLNLSVSAMSPPQILDRHIELGSDLHGDELRRLPLTSQPSVNWTHFGGPPPPDEINILKGQVQLLHNQLLYERHKRELHAQRNRRLLGKTHKAIAMEEIAATRLDELRCKDKENENMRIEVTKLREENSRLKEFNNNVTKEQQAFLRSHKEDKERLELKSKDHESKLRQQEEEIEELTKELKKTSAELFNVVNELEDLKEKAAMTDLYKAEVSRLKKQLVLMSEFQQKVLEKTKENTKCSNDEKLIIEKNIKEELVCYKDKVQHLTQQISAYTSRISELEATLSNKEMTAAEQKRFLENVKSLSKGQIQAMDGKYKALKKTNQRLEAHILKLYNQLEQRDGGVKVPASQSAMKHRKNSHEHLTKDSPPVSRESPLSSWSASSSVTGGSSVDSVSDGSPVRKNVKFASDASTSLIEPVRPLFNVNSPSITFSSESPFKKFHDTSGTKSSKANTLPKVRGVFEQSSTMARSYPPPGNIDRIVTMETQKLEAKNSEVQKTGQGEKS